MFDRLLTLFIMFNGYKYVQSSAHIIYNQIQNIFVYIQHDLDKAVLVTKCYKNMV